MKVPSFHSSNFDTAGRPIELFFSGHAEGGKKQACYSSEFDTAGNPINYFSGGYK